METAQFATTREIDDEPALKWWMHFNVIRRHRIIACVSKKIRRVTQKCVSDITISAFHAKKLEKIIGNTLLMDVINKGIEKLKVSFDVLEDETKISVGYNKTSVHLVFDVRMKIEQKTRWIKD